MSKICIIYCGASHRRHCTLLPLCGGTATQALPLSVLRTLTSLTDMLLLSLCARALSATCSSGTCGSNITRTLVFKHYSFSSHSLAFIPAFSHFFIPCVFSVVSGYALGFWSQHNERVSGTRVGQGPRLTICIYALILKICVL